MGEILSEKWMKGVAVTTTILAVLTAIASSRAGYCVAQAQLLTALEGSKWAYYQAKSIKQGLAESQLKAFEVALLGSTAADQRTLLISTMKDYQSNIARYDEEKVTIKEEAEKVGRDNAKIGRQGNQFSFSVVFFQIGIMLSSVGALLKRKEMWALGLIFGCIASVFLANGIFLFF
jgi:hypothetical protein